MHIVVHDFAGHPFPLQLARQLARGGHRVHHLYCASVIGGKGKVAAQEDDPDGLSIRGLGIGRPVTKAKLLRRFVDEYRYGRLAADRIAAIDPDVVLNANTPLDSLRSIQRRCRARGIKVVNWLQDINSLAVAAILPRKLPVLGHLVARRYLALERGLLRRADHVVPVSGDFGAYLGEIGIGPRGHTVIENWMPLDEMPLRPRHNHWSARHGLDAGRCVLYAGNLGFKQDPGLLLALAKAMGDARPRDRLVVVSEGAGAAWLAERQAGLRLPNLLLLPFQPWSEVPEMMAAADVLVALLESQERVYCVPSKVLSYCCAGRPIVLAADPANPASRLVTGHRCGRAVAAGDRAAFQRAVLHLLADEDERRAGGENARRYAESAFDIESIAARFEAVLGDAIARGVPRT